MDRQTDLDRLIRQVAYACERVPFYRDRFAELGVKPIAAAGDIACDPGNQVIVVFRPFGVVTP